MSEQAATCPLRQSVLWACLLAAVGLTGLLALGSAWFASRDFASEAAPSPLASLEDGGALPGPDDFPVRWGEQELLGGQLGQSGVAFAVLEQTRGALAPGAPAPGEGENLYGLRVGAAIDAESGVDPANYRFELADASGGTYAPSAVSTPGRLLPGPALNLFEVYFPLPTEARPATVTIYTEGSALVLPACPVPRPEPDAE
ncbi:MAG: hypothetical protein KBA64_00360 [Armatimonadetes bacterium]|nr:hypothetical protein [Armatimonadota bacterium]MDI9602598.1 hypothetical protein [Acidobacteriota bacterium]NLN88643.1 hypothetical protein [candidate division WS1 bacterium]